MSKSDATNARACVCTLNNGQKDDDDEEEERDVEHYSVNFVIVSVGRIYFVTDATTGSHAFIQMKDETLQMRYERVTITFWTVRGLQAGIHRTN